MARMVLKATELEGVDVSRIALVTKAANRLPYRIIKSEEGEVMDLYKIARSVFQKSDPKPAVVGAFIGDNFAATIGNLKKADIGFPGDIKKADDDVVLLGKAEATDAVLVKLDDNTLLTVSHLAKSFTDGVPEFVGYTAGSVPSIGLAMDAMVRTIKSEMGKDKLDQKALASLIKQAAGEFADFAAVMAENLPASVLKADVLFKGVTQAASMITGAEDEIDGTKVKKGDGKACDEPDGDEDEAKGKKKPAFMKGDGQTITPPAKPSAVDDNADSMEENQKLAKGEVIADKPVNGSKTSEDFKTAPNNADIEEDPTEGNPKGKTGTKVQDAPKATSNDIEGNPAMQDHNYAMQVHKAEMETLMKGLFASFAEEMGGQMHGMQKQIAALTKTASTAMETARKAEEAVNGYVGAEPEADRVGMRKSDRAASLPPLLDTGYSRVA